MQRRGEAMNREDKIQDAMAQIRDCLVELEVHLQGLPKDRMSARFFAHQAADLNQAALLLMLLLNLDDPEELTARWEPVKGEKCDIGKCVFYYGYCGENTDPNLTCWKHADGTWVWEIRDRPVGDEPGEPKQWGEEATLSQAQHAAERAWRKHAVNKG